MFLCRVQRVLYCVIQVAVQSSDNSVSSSSYRIRIFITTPSPSDIHVDCQSNPAHAGLPFALRCISLAFAAFCIVLFFFWWTLISLSWLVFEGMRHTIDLMANYVFQVG